MKLSRTTNLAPVEVRPREVKIKKGIFGKHYIDEYQIISVIGKGVSGVVKRGRRQQEEDVAIKVFSLSSSDIEKFQQSHSEAYLLGKVNHPNILQLKDFMISKHEVYLVSSFFSCGDLFDVIASRGRMVESLAKKLFLQLISAISYLHKQRIAHRDLKPENILVDIENLSIQVCDFGLAIEWDSSQPLLTVPVGTTRCIPPEMISKTLGYNPFAVDSWACGVIYFFMLTGSFPFEAQSRAETFINIMELKFLPSSLQLLSSDALSFIRKILDPEPLTRPTLDQIAGSDYLAH
eukprot:c17257_g1_i1.p1 GENE.c17257_g1_i1~~c17257_g1_i1.p1  ORF type:complete len:292 (-),score=80.62 c17257_g1_i1:119-994(-)